jgi:hypothetical protein
MTLSIKASGIMTLRISTFGIMTRSITLKVFNTWYNDTQHHVSLCSVMLSVIMLRGKKLEKACKKSAVLFH